VGGPHLGVCRGVGGVLVRHRVRKVGELRQPEAPDLHGSEVMGRGAKEEDEEEVVVSDRTGGRSWAWGIAAL
jgi:hypothetical protein